MFKVLVSLLNRTDRLLAGVCLVLLVLQILQNRKTRRVRDSVIRVGLGRYRNTRTYHTSPSTVPRITQYNTYYEYHTATVESNLLYECTVILHRGHPLSVCSVISRALTHRIIALIRGLQSSKSFTLLKLTMEV